LPVINEARTGDSATYLHGKGTKKENRKLGNSN
jgi:hypothetical protein